MIIDIIKSGVLTLTNPLKSEAVYVMIDSAGLIAGVADSRAALAEALGYDVSEGVQVIDKAVELAGQHGVTVPDDMDIITRRVLCEVVSAYGTNYIIEAHRKSSVRNAK
ncbi:MAG: hypothetical protein EOM14_08465 [Clostridia bacterium]|nr:hypothetical protein [Clostridia bacterium]